MQSCICTHKPLNTRNPYNLRKAAYIAQSLTQTCAKAVQPTQSCIQLRTQTDTGVSNKSTSKILSIVAHSEKDKSTRVNRDWKKARNVNAPISLEDSMVNELTLSLEYGDMRKLLVHTDLTNEDSTRIKREISIFCHPKNLIEVLRARLTIAHSLTGNNFTTGSNQYCFTRTFLDG